MQRNTYLLLLLFFLSFTTLGAQNLQWVTTHGGGSFEQARSVVVDDSGYVYSTGFFVGTVDFDPGAGTQNLTSNGSTDAFVMKQDASGNLVWVKQVGGTGPEFSQAICLDSSGNVITAGRFASTVDFDPGPGIQNESATLSDVFVLKLNALGNFQWVSVLRGPSSEEAFGLSADAADNVFATGYTNSDSIDLDPGTGSDWKTSEGGNDIFLTKLDANGNYRWGHRIGGSGSDFGQDVTAARNGDALLTGYFNNTVDFDPGPGLTQFSANFEDVFVLRFDTAGTLVWGKSWGGTTNDAGYAVEESGNGEVIVGGKFGRNVDFDPGPGFVSLASVGNTTDGFVNVLDANGNYRRTSTFGGPGDQLVVGLDVDPTNRIGVTGYFTDDFDADPGTDTLTMVHQAGRDWFLTVLDPTGALVFADGFEGVGDDEAFEIAFTAEGDLVLAGYFETSADFGTQGNPQVINSVAQDDIFVQKIGVCQPTSGTFLATGCDSAVVNGITYSMDGVFLQNLTNAEGCDSLLTVTVDLQRTDSTLLASGCDSVVVNGITYDTTGTYTQNLVNGAGCDSLLTIQVTVGVFNGDTLMVTGCDSVTGNGTTYYASGTYLQTFQNQQGCDSVITIMATVNFASADTISVSGCDSVVVNGTAYFSSGTYTQNLTNAGGCDSTLTIQATVGNSNSETISVQGCDSVQVNGMTYTSSGTYTQNLLNADGCDSLLTLQVTINVPTSETVSLNGCDSLSVNGMTYFTSGTYTQNLNNAAGCDSTLTINATINASSAETILVNGCDSVVVNGQAYFSSGSFVQNLTNAAGCDSVLTVQATVTQSTGNILQLSGCDSVSVNGQVYFASGTYTQHFTNAAGCDSILAIQAIVNPSTSETIQVNGCDSVVVNGQAYFSSGSYIQNLTNAAGCDSTLTIQATVNTSSSQTIVYDACGPVTENGITYTASGTYFQNLVNAAGCDSLLTLSIAITDIDTTVSNSGNTLTSNNPPFFTFQWLDCDNGYAVIPGATQQSFTPTTTGNYAVAIDYVFCTDTSSCEFVDLSGRVEGEDLFFTLAPNPSRGQVHLQGQTGQSGELKVEMWNMAGQKVRSWTLAAGPGSWTLELPEVVNGLYFLRIGVGERTVSKKLLLQR